MFGLVILFAVSACEDERFSFDDPARGPADLVGGQTKVSNGEFFGGNDELPTARPVSEIPDDTAPPNCGTSCEAYCDALQLTNPVNRGVCKSLWGVGLEHQPIVRAEACRRMFVDAIGRFPSRDEVVATCDGKTWGEVAISLINRDDFVRLNKRHWSDRLLYDTQAVSVERIYDMDNLVAKLYRGNIAYDEFAAVVSAHPVLTRRHDTPEDRTDALFATFMGRPPLGTELADMSRLYETWFNGYYDHPDLGMRLPDAHIQYPCVGEDGEVADELRASCTSVLWGYHELIFTPDIRSRVDENGNLTMWSGILKAEEWEELQAPGQLLSSQTLFWEKAVDDVLQQYLGYELGHQVPAVRDELVRYFLEFNGDMRALHFAVMTSIPYLQSTIGNTPTDYRWTFGPHRQVDPETWVDSIREMTGYEISTCDHRLTRPDEFLEAGSLAGVALVERSNWQIRDVDDEGNPRVDYSYRNTVRPLGGCPDNTNGGRFKIISILTTAQQLNFVNEVCNPGFDGGGVDIEALLPRGVNSGQALNPDLAEEIYSYQVGQFLGRLTTDEERAEVREYGEQCSGCSAAQFARPTCFAVLSTAEMLFY